MKMAALKTVNHIIGTRFEAILFFGIAFFGILGYGNKNEKDSYIW